MTAKTKKTTKHATHTPGPWRVEIEGTSTGRGPVILCEETYSDDPANRQLAELEISETNERRAEWRRSGDADEIEANARLMAAAPDLLEALRDLVEAFPAGDDGMEVAGSFGADAELSYARIILNQIDSE
jgi:hypothetical protein